ncbi:MAG: group II intron reverse transcriptase/maturase [Spirochaetes bacterium]|nr:MAG: group II intron reverse transcriptase/maturase [Spirochaetota bacterium]RKX78451.1 MAG: group II intron reverse transcriptase/maturase [Spirochaetota bacterium]RKX92818.1 MAG: group II intron reverse transcriptase/maturase [Spirochaetota bacterium]
MTGKVYYSLYDRLLHGKTLYEAFKRVKASGGTGGIDHQDIESFESSIAYNIQLLVEELRNKTYKPLPVKRVEIPKGNGKMRLLGIPAVRDRVVQQALLTILQPIYEEDFHPSSYGYRPGRSSHQAISKASLFVRQYDLRHVVDMDLSRCFDTLKHDLIIKFMRKRVTDNSILSLVEKFLKSGVMRDNVKEESLEGSPQGGVISPLLANIYLNEFDQFMMKRNYRIVRYADDILIMCPSQRSATHALEVASDFLEKTLLLTVNRDKTHITHSDSGIKFLGVVILSSYTLVQEEKIKSFKKKVKSLTRKNQGMNLEMVIRRLNPLLRGFANYFRIANCSSAFCRLMGWIRRRLRAIQLKLWKKPRRLHRRLRQLGCKGNFPLIRMTCWRNSQCISACIAMPNKWFSEIGLFDMVSVGTGLLVPV